MAEIRVPEEKDRSAMIELVRISFNPPAAYLHHVAPQVRLHRYLCAFEAERLVAMAASWELDQWIGGRPLPTSGISAVAAQPERRNQGAAPECVRLLLRRARDAGAVFSSLYPSRAAVYRRLGYEYAGHFIQHRIPLADLPPVPSAGVEELDDSDLGPMQTLFRRFAAGQNGLVECAAEDWWRLRVIRRWNPDVVSRLVVARGEDGAPEGYASFSLEPAGDLWGFRVTCSHLVACTPRALSGLLGYFRSFRGLGQYLVWTGPPHDPIPLMAGGGAESIQPQRTARFMARILDVKGALEGRGYPPVAGAATLAVEDDLFPENEGTWRIQASGGEVSAGRIDGAAPGARMGIRGLSALFTGYVSPGELVRAGLAAGDEAALSLLGKLFSGPAPWSMDFF